MLRHPHILGDPQQSGAKPELVHDKGEQNQKWLPHPYLLGGSNEGGNATSPLHSRGSPIKWSKIRCGYLTSASSEAQRKGGNAMSPLHSREYPIKWSSIRCGYLTSASSEAQRKGGNAMSPLHSRGSPTKGSKTNRDTRQRGTNIEVVLPSPGPKGGRKCYGTPTFSGIPNKGEQNQNWSPAKGNKMRTSPMHSRGPKGGRKWYATPEFSGFPKKIGQHEKTSPTKGIKIKCGYNPAISRAQRRAEMLRHPCILGDPKKRGAKSEVVPDKGEQNQKWLPHPCLLTGRKKGGNATPPLYCWRSPTKRSKIRSGYLTRAFSGGPKEGGNGTSPPHSREYPIKWSKTKPGPQQRGTKSEVATSPLPSQGPKEGQNSYVIPAFSGIPNNEQ